MSGNIMRGSCQRSLIINVSPKSIVVSAMESNEEMKRLIDTFRGAISSNGRILLSILRGDRWRISDDLLSKLHFIFLFTRYALSLPIGLNLSSSILLILAF